MLTITLKPALAEQVQQFATTMHQPVEQVLETAVQEYLEAQEIQALQTEAEFFWAHQSKFIQQYPDQTLAIYHQQVIDHDQEATTLEIRIRQKYSLAPVLIVPVDAPRELHWRGARE